MSLAQIMLFFPAAVVVAASPGANNLLAFSNGSRQGFVPAVIGLSGRCVAFALLIAMVIMGLGALLQSSEIAFQMIKWAGVLYLLYLGIRMMLSKSEDAEPEAGVRNERNGYALARREFMVAMTNPKAILLFTAFVPQFVISTDETSFTQQFSLLAALYILVEFFAATGWALAGSLVRAMRPSARRLCLMNRISGALMVAAAGVLAFTKRA